MYIYKIVIENFKNFKKFEWKPNKTLNIIFGHNGCGKSTIADALDLLFSSKKNVNYFEASDYYKLDTSQTILIQAWLHDIDDLNIENKELVIQYIDPNDKIIDEDCNLENCKDMVITQLKSIEDGKMSWSLFSQTDIKPFNISSRENINYNYINTNRNPLKELNFGWKTLLQDLAKNIIGDELKRISKESNTFANTKINESDKIKQFVDETLSIDKNIYGIEKYKIISKDLLSSDNYSSFQIGSEIDSYSLPLQSHSTGIQNLLLLSLMQKKLEGKGIVFVEELEQNLEPINQKYIINKYKNLNIGQLFITSHSPDIIDSFNYENIFYLKNSFMYSLFTILNNDEGKEICKFNKLNFISSIMSKNILLVEGESEYVSFPIYLAMTKKDLDCSILYVGGKTNFKKYTTALNKLDFKPFILTDNDSDINKTISELDTLSEKIFISNNCYEDWIYCIIKDYANKLEDYIQFNYIRQKLLSLTSKDYIQNEILSIGRDNLISYDSIKNLENTFKYVLHDSYAGIYFSKVIAYIISESNIVPTQFKYLLENIIDNKPLKKYDNKDNVLYLEEIANDNSK